MNVPICKLPLLLLFVVLLFTHTTGFAALPLKVAHTSAPMPDSAVTLADKAETTVPAAHRSGHLSLFKKAKLLKQFYKLRNNTPKNPDNTLGIISFGASMLAIVCFFSGMLLAGGAAPGLAAALLVLFPLSAIAAIILGVMGRKRDRNRGWALAGMITGIVELGLAVLIGMLVIALAMIFG